MFSLRFLRDLVHLPGAMQKLIEQIAKEAGITAKEVESQLEVSCKAIEAAARRKQQNFETTAAIFKSKKPRSRTSRLPI